MALDTTVGGASANSYATLTEFNTYADSRLPAVTWFATATDAQKEAALIMGARLLDAMFAWTGAAVDSVQVLCWPRSGMLTRNGFSIDTTENPQALKDAQCEFALQLGAGDRVSDNDAVKQGISSVTAGSVSVEFKDVSEDTAESVDMILRRMGSDFNYLNKTVPDAVRQLLVPSWYSQPSIKRPMVFKAL